MPTPTALTFLLRYLADESFRDEVRAHHDNAMGQAGFGLSANDVAALTSLDSARFRPVLEREMPAATVTELIDSLRVLGLDPAVAKGIIWDRKSECETDPDPNVSSLKVGGGYGAGATHVRGISPRRMPAGTNTLEIRGQGFGPDVAVRFDSRDDATVQVPGTIVARRCGIDVHQYLTVRVTLGVGAWNVAVYSTTSGQFETAPCWIEVF